MPTQLISADDITVLRERILQSFLLTTLGMGLVLFILVSPGFMQAQRLGVIAILLTLLVFVGGLALLRQMSYLIRVVIFLGLLLFIGIGTLYLNGINGGGPVILVGFIAISTILLGTWTGTAAASTALIAMLGMGVLLSQNILPVSTSTSVEFNAPFSEWINRSLVVLMIGGLFVISISIIIEGLRQSLRLQKQMAEDLKREKNKLEEKVASRTMELERRAFEIETASQISRDISQFNKLEELLASAVELIRKEYHLYYSAIFLMDDQKEYAVLQYGSGEAGQTMVAIKHRLKAVETSLVGYAISKQEYRLSQDVSLDSIHFKNPLLPETQSELAIPLKVNGEIIGALDMQSNVRQFFTPGDIRALQIAADQLAVAIDKARLVQKLNQTLDDLRNSYRQATQQSWQGFLEAARRSYSFNFKQGKLAAAQTADLHALQALQTGEPVVERIIEQGSGKLNTTVAVPIKLREQILGVLDLHFDSRMVPSNSLEVLDAVANRLALALENARLLEEIQMHAAREHLVGSISAKVRSETEVDKVLRTVAEELGRSLGVTDVLVQLREDEG